MSEVSRTNAPLEARRLSALESGIDSFKYPDTIRAEHARAIEAAIETATRVKIDRDMLADFARAWHEAPQDGPPGTRRRAGLAAAFRAAGFEVEE